MPIQTDLIYRFLGTDPPARFKPGDCPIYEQLVMERDKAAFDRGMNGIARQANISDETKHRMADAILRLAT